MTTRSEHESVGRKLEFLSQEGKTEPALLPLAKVFLIEEQPLLRVGIKALLAKSDHTTLTGEAGTAAEALATVAQSQPDVIITAFNLPDARGGVIVEQLHAICPQAAIVVLTTAHSCENLMKAMDAGARGYVLKTADPSLLIKAIHAVCSGEIWIQREVVGEVFTGLHKTASRHSPSNYSSYLTPREVEILRALAIGHSTTQIADDLCITENTVRVHIMKIVQRLGLQNRVEAIRYAIKEGLVEL